MAPKSIPISFRISPDDAAFIAGLEIEGAVTPSEKIRGLIAKAQRDQASRRTFAECAMMMREALAPTVVALEEAERDIEVHSELMRLLLDWLPETMASLITATPPESGDLSLDALSRAERSVADRTVRLLESVLRMAVTHQCDAYDPDLFARRLDRVLELSDLIKAHRLPSIEEAGD